ncbi:Bacteriophage head to tail connecting protein [Candidatus Hepatincolaceae symbiont of Richtersius coronifer]
MSHSSYYIDVTSKEIVLKSGYYEFPYMITRWYTNAYQEYGQSPAMAAMPDIKMINSISKTMLIAAQKQVDPPILAPNEGAIQGIRSVPGGIIYGGIDPITGNQLLKPLSLGGDLSNTYTLQEQRRASIREAFYNSLLMFNYSNNATATEVVSVNEQKLRILGSKIARIQTEFLYPLLKRQYFIMQRLGLLPNPPKGVDINNIEIDFFGPWNRYQKMVDSIGMQQLGSVINTLKQFDPNVVQAFDWLEVVKLIAEGNGVPENLFNKSIHNKSTPTN